MSDLHGLGAIALLLGCFAPGYLLSMTWSRDWLQGLDLGECLFVQLASGLILNSWVMLLLAELEVFSLPAIVVSWLAICGVLAWIGRQQLRRSPFPRLKWSWAGILLTVLLLLAAFLFARPAESFLTLDDSGIYVLGGIHLAKTGSLFVRDALAASLSPDAAEELFFTGPTIAQWTRQWGQFFLWNWRRPWVVFGLLHGQRLWCALFTLFLGTAGGLWVAPAFGLVATAGLYFLGRRLFSAATGLLGASLLTINFAQIWHARYPLSEMLAQAVVVTGFYLLALATQKRHVWLSVLAGLCLGGLFLVRVDAVLMAAVLLGFALYQTLRSDRQQYQVAFGLALGLALGYSSFHNAAWSWPYLVSLWRAASSPGLTKVLLFGALSLGALMMTAALRPKLWSVARHWLSDHVWQVVGAVAAALAVLIASIYAFSQSGWNARGIVWLTEYWTTLGLLLAAAGLALVLLRRRTRLALPLVVTGLVYFTLFTVNPMVNRFQPWAMRRFVPVVMPVLALLTAYAISTLSSLSHRFHHLVQALAVVALAITFLRIDRPFLSYTEYEGMEEQIAQLAAQFEDGAVILFDQGDLSLYVSQPLAYLHGLDTFVLQKPRPESSILQPLLEDWQRSGRPIYLVLSSGTLDWHPVEWAFVPEATFNLHLTRIRRSVSRPPKEIEHTNFVLEIYEVLASDALKQSPPSSTHRLDMEAGEYPYLRGGFYGSETTTEGLTYRWTNGQGRIQLAHLDTTTAVLRLRVAGGRPAGVESARLAVLVNGAAVAEERLPSGFTFQLLEIPLARLALEASSDGLSIELQSTTWTPASSAQNGDQRELGVVVDWLEVQ